jgi:class 3 adenylate cyclase
VIGYSSAACGADLLFLESLSECGGDAVVVLPFAAARFAQHSVDFAGPEWRARFDAALKHVGEPVIASTWNSPASGAAYDYANRILCGLAKIQADLLDVPLALLAVWDGRTHGEIGGAATLVERWKGQGLPVVEIRIDELGTRLSGRPAAEAASPKVECAEESHADARQELVAMLFADAVGFSMLSDEQILPFVTRFLNRIAGLMREAAMPLAVNTWGDGFFATFRGVGEAGRFALKLAEVVETTDWKSDGLPAEFNIRMALHAGPVFAIRDPVTDRPGYWGGHVSRAARIEPITPPGQVYASQAFAALARDEGECGFACHYVGRTPLAKDYGTFPTYHVVVSR